MTDKKPSNPDPITGEPGAHPVGTGVGATGGAVAGATVGSVAGPVGTVVGAAIGAVAGGMAGKAAAEGVNPTVEDSYWRENYNKHPSYKSDYTYDDYAPAFRSGYTGWERAQASGGKSFDSIEPRCAATGKRPRASPA